MIEAVEPVNYSALDALKSVLGGDFPVLIRDFRSQTACSLVKLELAIARADRDAIANTAHLLKGSALSLHAKPLAALCRDLEALAPSAKKELLEASVSNLHSAVGDVIKALEEWAYQ